MADAATSPVSQILARLDQFTEEELVHPNRLVVERLRLMRHVRGVLTRYHRKSVPILADTGQSWTVPASMLRPEPA